MTGSHLEGFDVAVGAVEDAARGQPASVAANGTCGTSCLSVEEECQSAPALRGGRIAAVKEPGQPTVKTLFALSGNVCAFFDEDDPRSGCEQQLTDPTWKRVMGRVCHIYGEKEGSARWDPDHDDDGHEFWNLILLCPTHHTVIDDTEPHRFPSEKLRRMKERHERANGKPPNQQPWWQDESALERMAAAALAAYARLQQVGSPSESEDPWSDVADQRRALDAELGYHRAWAQDHADRFKDDGLDGEGVRQYEHHLAQVRRIEATLAHLAQGE